MNIPQDIQDKIVAKRTPVAEEKKEEVKAPEADTPTEKKEAPTKSNGQSIAQIAEGMEDSAKEDDKPEDKTPDEKKEDKPKKKSVFEDLIETKRELKELRKEATENEIALMEDVKTLLAKVEKLEKAGIAPTKEVQEESDALLKELEEEYGLDKKGFDKLETLLKKRLGITSTSKEDKGDDDTKKRVDALEKEKQDEKRKQEVEKQIKTIETAIANEFNSLVKTFPDVKDAVSLQAITRYILSDKDNLTKSMEEIVREMYPKALGEKQSIDGYNGGADHTKIEIDPLDPQTEVKLRKDPNFRKSYQEDLRRRVRGNY
jgi:hypothetical protein